MAEETKILDYRLTEIGRQNWDVCWRMLAHDLLDLRKTNKDVADLLKYYSMEFTSNGGYTLALPRKYLPQFQKIEKETSVKLKKKSKKSY